MKSILAIERKIKSGKATVADIEALAELKHMPPDEFPPIEEMMERDKD